MNDAFEQLPARHAHPGGKPAHPTGRRAPDGESAARRRARNAVWNAAGDYALSVPDPVITGDAAGDLYRNTAQGLVAKHYGRALSDLRESWREDYRADELDRVARFAFEAAAFRAETADRPALAPLRASFLAALPHDERAIADAVEPPAAAAVPEPASTVEQRIRRELRARYRFDGTVVKAPEPTLHLGLSLLGMALAGTRPRPGGMSAPANARTETRRGQLRRALEDHVEKRRRTRDERDRAAIETRFGALLCSPAELERLEHDVCTGAHAGCHLWLADGAAPDAPATDPRLAALARAADEQRRANRAFYEENRRTFEAASRRLSQNLVDRLHSTTSFTRKRCTRGQVDAARAWRLALLDDDHVFSRRVPAEDPGIAIDLLLDASGSRTDACASVAAQAFVVGTSFARCGIDVRIWAFSSMRGYTVLERFNASTAAGELAHVFRYTASGMNRDGLALRCVGALEPARSADRRLVLMLTDAAPMDDTGMVQQDGAPGGPVVDYNGRAAVDDTARIVRELRSRGIAVCALFDGEDAFAENARLIFGTDLLRVRRIERMADGCAALVATALEKYAR